jgi:hypothetical protein
MITSTIKAISTSDFFEKTTMKRLSGCARSWLVLELTMKERKISSTNASMAIGMSRIGGWMWNGKGECIIDGVGNIPEDIRLNLTLSTSEWLQRFKGDAMDYLLKKQSPETLRTLERLKNSEFLHAILEVDGPARRTWLQCRKRLVPEDDDDDLFQVAQGRNDNEAGPSGTSNDIV